MERYCKDCGTPVGKGKSYCEFDAKQRRKKISRKYSSKFRKLNPNYHSEYDAKHLPQRYCKDCGVEIPKGKYYCESHREQRIKENRKKYIRQYKRNAREDIVFRIAENISNQVHQAMKGINKNKRTFKSLGYTPEELKQQFTEGMSWDNYGINGWHIDHIIPKTEFPFTSLDDKNFKKCWSLDNLQPLWADENRKKSNKI